ncbi:prepilin peptidase [Trinickia fusca]|uniref:Prepilin leader peptidase/N-methyltransferase n=1 Tax=Trinickia fusca TaxID=2419777 RepID=A0A494XMR0_9BURK|nr:A24 family peptidase [Trinickia fusca]RKP51042.1 prepilin peptidase [Trinickia fusca]
MTIALAAPDVPHWPLYVFAAFAGASLTSFACLAADRLPHQLGWRPEPQPDLTLCHPPSRCDACAVRIGWPYLIPVVGYLLARGRCAHCGARVPPAYPLLEALGGGGACAALAYFGFAWTGISAALLWLVLLFLAWIDWREQWLPAVVTQPLFWLGLLSSPFSADAMDRIQGAFGGCVLMWLAMKVVGFARRADLVAGGDIALAAAAGAWLGLTALPLFLLVASLGFLAYAWPLRRRGRLFVPMGPALALGWIAAQWALPAWRAVLQGGWTW